MLKQCLLILLAFSLIAIAVPMAAAQSNDAPPNSQQPGEAGGGRHHGMMDPAQRTQELTKKLKLTSDQQSKVQGILESEHTQMESLRDDSSSSQQDRHSKMMDIHQNGNTQIRALLDSNQQKKWDEMQTNREERMGRHHGAGASDNPPPQ